MAIESKVNSWKNFEIRWKRKRLKCLQKNINYLSAQFKKEIKSAIIRE